MTEVKRVDELQGDILHEYDGIEEADNSLPNWWLGILFGSVVFAIGYWFAYHEYGLAPSHAEEFAAQMAQVEAQRQKAAAEGMAGLDDPAKIAAGAETFKLYCIACHGPKAEGNIGPNLTDKFWIHGGAPTDIHTQVTHGVPAKGMPSWGPVLGPAKVSEVVAYVLSLRNTNVPGKEPQGEEWTGQP